MPPGRDGIQSRRARRSLISEDACPDLDEERELASKGPRDDSEYAWDEGYYRHATTPECSDDEDWMVEARQETSSKTTKGSKKDDQTSKSFKRKNREESDHGKDGKKAKGKDSDKSKDVTNEATASELWKTTKIEDLESQIKKLNQDMVKLQESRDFHLKDAKDKADDIDELRKHIAEL